MSPSICARRWFGISPSLVCAPGATKTELLDSASEIVRESRQYVYFEPRRHRSGSRPERKHQHRSEGRVRYRFPKRRSRRHQADCFQHRPAGGDRPRRGRRRITDRQGDGLPAAFPTRQATVKKLNWTSTPEVIRLQPHQPYEATSSQFRVLARKCGFHRVYRHYKSRQRRRIHQRPKAVP
jgi:hypothetical protein